MKRKEKLAEYRGANREQLRMGLEGTGKEPVSPAVPVRDRPAGNAPARIRKAKRDIARILTVITENKKGREERRPPMADPTPAGEGGDPVARATRPGGTAGSGRVLTGVVTRDKMDKTRRVEIPGLVKHARYGKYISAARSVTRTTRRTSSRIGDTVEIMETRPLSKNKNWRLVRVVTKAPRMTAAEAPTKTPAKA